MIRWLLLRGEQQRDLLRSNGAALHGPFHQCLLLLPLLPLMHEKQQRDLLRGEARFPQQHPFAAAAAAVSAASRAAGCTDWKGEGGGPPLDQQGARALRHMGLPTEGAPRAGVYALMTDSVRHLSRGTGGAEPLGALRRARRPPSLPRARAHGSPPPPPAAPARPPRVVTPPSLAPPGRPRARGFR